MANRWRESARLNPKPQSDMFLVYGIGFPGALHQDGIAYDRVYTTEIAIAEQTAHIWVDSQQFDVVIIYRVTVRYGDDQIVIWEQVGGPIKVLQSQ